MDYRKDIALQENIKDFVIDAFNYIWKEQTFYNDDIKKQFDDERRLSDESEKKVRYFSKNIGSAVFVSQFFFREYFKSFFDYENTKSVFKYELKLILLYWLRQRDDTFVMIIDSLAIFAEAFLYNDYSNKFTLNLKEIAEWFMELFEEQFMSEFLNKGGWIQLENKALTLYRDLYEALDYFILNSYMDYSEYIKNFSDEVLNYRYCSIIECLGRSEIVFPVPEEWFCEECEKHFQDEQMKMAILYVKPEEKILKTLAKQYAKNERRKTGKACSDETNKNIQSRENDSSHGDSSCDTKNSNILKKCSTDNMRYSLDDEKMSLTEKIYSDEAENDLSNCESTSAGVNLINTKMEWIRIGEIDQNRGKVNSNNKNDYLTPGKDYSNIETYVLNNNNNYSNSTTVAWNSTMNDLISANAIHRNSESASDTDVSSTESDDSSSESYSEISEQIVLSEKRNKILLTKILEEYFTPLKTDFCFIAKQYSHSVDNMLKSLFGIQSGQLFFATELKFSPDAFDLRLNSSVFIGGKKKYNYINTLSNKRARMK